jgi:hypothetical protein
MPTSFPCRQSKPVETRDLAWRDVMIAAAVLIAMVRLICDQTLGPTFEDYTQLQLLP